jgi:c-di-GMP-binding flagellar brake protein YcgR
MGAPAPRPKNPFMAQGLLPGTALRIDVSARDGDESYATRIEDVDGEHVAILVPMRGLKPRPLPVGTLVRAAYIFRNKRWRFVTEVAGHSEDGAWEYLRLPAFIDCHERRRNYRLQVAIKPSRIYRLVVPSGDEPETEVEIDGTIVDLSESGCCIASKAFAMPGERLGLEATLPEAGDIAVRARVVFVREPERGYRMRRIHCEFLDMPRAQRDLIARYLMRRQLEMRRRGQL